jgi:hypothetical protein
VSDVEGAATIRWTEEPTIYRFGTGTAEFLICPRCGSCIAAVDRADGPPIAVLNLNAFDDPRLDVPATATDFEGEASSQRSARRRRVWTPATLG